MALDTGPFLVGHEGRPGGDLGRLVGPFEKIDEFRPVGPTGLPHRDDPEAVFAHDPRSMVAKARVERRLVRLEDLVDAQLVNHRHLGSRHAASTFRKPMRIRRWFYSSPSSSRASSLIRSCVHGGVQTSLTRTSPTPGTVRIAFSTSPGSEPATGQDGAVRVIST